MGELAVVLTVISAALVGVGSFLYNDGHDHALAGLASAGIGGVAFVISAIVQQQRQADAGVECLVFGRGCAEYYSPTRVLWDGLLKGIVEEAVLVVCCGALGLLAAKLTSRRPADSRRATVIPPDD